MVFTNKRGVVLVQLAKVAKLCEQSGLVGWDRWLREVIKLKVGSYEGPDCRDVLEKLKRGKWLNQDVETYETMLCNELSTYIDIMPLDRNKIPTQAPPFMFLNNIVLAHAAEIEVLVAHLLVNKEAQTGKEHMQCFEAEVPIEYLHTLVRSYHNKVLLMGYLGKKHLIEYEELSRKCWDFYDQYQLYPPEEIDRVSKYYARTCLGEPYRPKPKQATEDVENVNEESGNDK